jgi:hypothetical protein
MLRDLSTRPTWPAAIRLVRKLLPADIDSYYITLELIKRLLEVVNRAGDGC